MVLVSFIQLLQLNRRCNAEVHVDNSTACKFLMSKKKENYKIIICFLLSCRFNYQERSLRSSNGSATKSRTQNSFGKVVVSEYAVCSKKTCGFEFCTNCDGNRHVNAKCTKRPLGSSPKSDEDSPYRQEHRNKTKRSMRRLGRLVF